MDQINFSPFIQKLGYDFKNLELLQQALTHRSVKNKDHNERMEFLGDALLSSIIAKQIFNRLPFSTEGDLTRIRSKLVCEEALAKIARGLGIGKHLNLGVGEKKSGAFGRDSILADALEAVIAAIYLDTNMDMVSVESVVLKLYQPFLEDLDQSYLIHTVKDAKSMVQEHLQARQLALPEYILEKTTGHEHQQVFYVICKIVSLDIETQGSGSSRRKAEQMAASHALEVINADRTV